MHAKANPANLISMLRVGLVVVVVFFLVDIGGKTASLWAMVLIAASMMLDVVDGVVARSLGSQSHFGDLVDRMADYIVANTMWIALSVMEYVPVWVPIITMGRDFFVLLRHGAYNISHNKFQWLASSRVMRATYGAMKLASWELVIMSMFVPLGVLPLIFVWVTVGLCLLRALPNVLGGFHNLRSLR